jgi:hypothetical protein
MALISNYKFKEKLHEGCQFIVYRGVCQAAGQARISAYTSPEQTAASAG